MTKREMKQALLQGKRVTHRFFSEHEWLEQHGEHYVLEDGIKLFPSQFWILRTGLSWQYDWSIVEKAADQ